MNFQKKILSFILGGVSVVAGVSLTSSIELVGATEQIPYVIMGIILGSILFSFASYYIFSNTSLVFSSAISLLIVVFEYIFVQSYPLLDNLSIAALFAGCCSLLLPAGRVTLLSSQRRDGFIYTALGSIIIFSAAALIYLLNGYSGLAQISDGVELFGLLGLLLLILTKRAEQAKAKDDSLQTARQNIDRKTAFASLSLIVVLSLSPCHILYAESQVTATPIKHVVIIMMENHSFDNLFGVYPFSSIHNTTLSSSNSSFLSTIQMPDNLIGAKNLPSLSKVPQGSFVTKDPIEGYIAYHLDWANGSMLGFQMNSGEQAMTYFTSSQLGIEWSIAEQYALADMYFAGGLTETAPNRLLSLAGYTPVINDYGPPPYIPYEQSIFSELDRYGVSWGYYVENPSKGAGTLSYFYRMPKNNIESWQQFFDQLSSNSLPSVSWLMPVDGGAVGYSQGPPSGILKGELWLLYTLQKLETSPEWNSTALFITYDEGGGYYDHVAPPKLMGMQLGERVPMIVVSAYAKEDYISNTIMTHTSLLAFIDYNWHLPSLNNLVANSNLPLDMFDFNISYPDGKIARQPINFQLSGLPVPPSYSIEFNSTSSIVSLSSYFPMLPQIPFEELPYGREGESNMTLSSLSYSTYVTKNDSFFPFYESDYFVALLYIANMVLAAVLIRKFRRSTTSP